MDLAGPRQMINEEQASWPGMPGFDGEKAMRRLPTTRQLADNLTKIIGRSADWWKALKALSPSGST